MSLFKHLTHDQAEQFRQWARKNYEPLSNISGVWHPVVQAECCAMNMEKFGATAEGAPDPKAYATRRAILEHLAEHPGSNLMSLAVAADAAIGDTHEAVSQLVGGNVLETVNPHEDWKSRSYKFHSSWKSGL